MLPPVRVVSLSLTLYRSRPRVSGREQCLVVAPESPLSTKLSVSGLLLPRLRLLASMPPWPPWFSYIWCHFPHRAKRFTFVFTFGGDLFREVRVSFVNHKTSLTPNGKQNYRFVFPFLSSRNGFVDCFDQRNNDRLSIPSRLLVRSPFASGFLNVSTVAFVYLQLPHLYRTYCNVTKTVGERLRKLVFCCSFFIEPNLPVADVVVRQICFVIQTRYPSFARSIRE